MTVPGRSLRLRPTTIWLSCGVCVDARNDRLGRDEGPGGGGDDGETETGTWESALPRILCPWWEWRKECRPQRSDKG